MLRLELDELVLMTPHRMKVLDVRKTVVRSNTPWKNRSWVVGLLTSEREVAVEKVDIEFCEAELMHLLETLYRFTFLSQLIGVLSGEPTIKVPTEPLCPSSQLTSMKYLPSRLIPFQPAKSTVSVSTISLKIRYPITANADHLEHNSARNQTVVRRH